MEPRTVLVVEDEPAARRLLRACLESDGYAVIEAQTMAQVEARLAQNHVDLVTLDINLGQQNGLDIARALRRVSAVPIIMVTGLSDVIDRVVGLEVGADDYITKPFHVREVLARVRAVLRRAAAAPDAVVQMTQQTTAPQSAAADCLAFDGLLADLERMELLDRDGRPCDLTSGDFGLLKVFLNAPGRVLSRDAIMDRLKGADWVPLDRTVDNQVARLRKKIERHPGQPKLIKTVRGVGYLLAAEIERRPRSRDAAEE